MECNWFNILSGIASIISLVFTCWTLYVAKNVRRAINETNKKYLFKNLSEEETKKLSELNGEYVRVIETNNENLIKLSLQRIVNQLLFLKSYTITISFDDSIKFLNRLSSYNYISDEQTKNFKYSYRIFRKIFRTANQKDLYEGYIKVVKMIDLINNLRKTQNILS